MKVYYNRRPRSLALVQGDNILIIRGSSRRNVPNQQGSGSGGNNAPADQSPPKCIIEFAKRDSIKFDQYRLLSPHECQGCLGLIEINYDVYLCVITKGAEVAQPRPGETVNRIYSVEFYCVNNNDWDFVTLDANGYAIDQNIGLASAATDSLNRLHIGSEHPCASIRKLLSNGSFYYSSNFDVATVLQYRGGGSNAKKSTLTMEMADRSFMWNSFMTEGLINFRNHLSDSQRQELDECHFLTTAIRGFAESKEVRIGSSHEPAMLTIISRQSWRRAGTRYNARGVDDEGNVANFVETETILSYGDLIYGFTQIRGSVPIFWEQDANIISAKINITRSSEATQPAFNKHFEQLVQKFGIVHVVNLLANKPGEYELSERYRNHILASRNLKGNLGLTEFDFHAEVASRGYSQANRIIPLLQEAFLEISFYSNNARRPADKTEQHGIFRTNCLDCLDRTNLVQQLISKEALMMFFELYRIPPGQDIWAKHNFIWADNGDQLSQIYAGTNALKTSFTRSGKMGFAGALADVTKSVGRLYINNFVDKGRQNTMDLLLGRTAGQQQVVLHDPINDYVTVELTRRVGDFSSTRNIKVFAGTFNLNGVMSPDDLSGWLFPPDGGREAPDIVLVGFQEIVELTPSQILNAEPYKREFWETRVANTLNQRDEYVLVRSDQLVGTALMMFVRKAEVSYVKNVEGAMIKTGLGGMAGNKGGIAVSFYFASTSFCFITAHLAAGPNNIDERHHNFKTISSGLVFSRGRRIKAHDSIIWLGDFNYRINMPYEYVKEEIKKGNLEKLFEKDQLYDQMVRGETFPFYNEMQINFPPTYKFDNDSNEYDTSEKMRTPSWTDRILSRGTNLHQTSYGCVPKIMFSDHRPVYATFNATVVVVDEDIKNRLANELYNRRRLEVGDANDLVSLIDLNETTLTHGLPPPSSDSRKWWIAGGQSTKVNFQPPTGTVINPDRDTNPFVEDVDFIKPPLPPRPHTFTSGTKPPSAPAISGNKPEVRAAHRSNTIASGPGARQMNRKSLSPPPVPRKPVSLSSKPTASGVAKSAAHKPASTPSPTPIPTTAHISASSSPSSEAGVPAPPPKRKSVKSNGTTPPTGSKNLLDDDGDAESVRGWTPPPMVPTSGANSVKGSSGGHSTPKSLLDDDDQEGAAPSVSGLTLLQPTS
ncbi:uncharacterized protein SAPINGB_P001237 [Magnusiomyces paraingens]|uniref:phosphoinositide 5-phosphatase n=1 Tax=Magnusiomyces paraingens TaxID=2606893 RepID=A0A5E8B599_9ASCO|nr:uncharacterized protein SAPINGB_P001237 [Saprochaete ingens]VVT46486.1 unnamed protein product [Saprochaete ingens]